MICIIISPLEFLIGTTRTLHLIKDPEDRKNFFQLHYSNDTLLFE